MADRQRQIEEQLLVRLAQDGDDDAFAQLIDRYDRRLLYYVRRLLAETDSAFDVMQSTWLVVHRRLIKLRSPEAFRVWLYRIAHDQAVSELRRKGLRPIAMEEPPKDLPDDQQEQAGERFENAELVHRTLSTISFEHRQVLTLRFLEEMSVEEITEITGIPAGTVKSRLHYAKLAMRTRIEELLRDQ